MGERAVVLLVGSMGGGGTEKTVARLSAYLAKRRYIVTVLALCGGESAYPLDKRVRFINTLPVRKSKNQWEAVANRLKGAGELRAVFRSLSPAVVLCFSITTLLSALLASILTQTKLIYCERGNPQRVLPRRFWQDMKKLLPRFVQGSVFQTDAARGFYSPYVQRHSIVLPNAVTIARDCCDCISDRQREDRIVSVGRLTAGKNIDLLILAFAEIQQEFPSFSLHLYGVGGEEQKLKALVQALAVEKAVVFHGWVEEIPAAICNSSLFVLPSGSEGFPNALLEAMACGLPCISADWGKGAAELIVNGVNGLLVRAGETAPLVEAIRTLLRQPSLAKRLGENARNVRNTHSAEQIYAKWQGYIDSVGGFHPHTK